MARRTKTEAQQTRDAILDAAEDTFYARGVSRTSMEQIAASAGVTRGAIYWHFKDKMELCVAMTERVFLPHEDMLDQLVAEQSAKPLADLRQACVHSLKLMATDKRRQKVVTILMLRCEYTEEMMGVIERRHECKDRMLAASEKLLARARRLKMLAPCWSPRKAALSLQALMAGLFTLGLENKNFDFAKVGVGCVESFFDSLEQ